MYKWATYFMVLGDHHILDMVESMSLLCLWKCRSTCCQSFFPFVTHLWETAVFCHLTKKRSFVVAAAKKYKDRIRNEEKES